jgi:predicted nucleotidyltransferase
MPIPDALRPLLSELKGRLQALYGDRLDRLVLYGSQARGDTHAESDVDVLVVLHGPVNPGQEIRRMSDVRVEMELDFDVALSLLPASTDQVETQPTQWLKNVRQEGTQI